MNSIQELNLGSDVIKNKDQVLAFFKAQKGTIQSPVSEKIYLWLLKEDPVLARQLRKLKYTSNFIKFTKARMDYLDLVKDGLENTIQEIKLNLYVTKAKLILDKEKCIRCDISHKVCPKEAVDVDKENIHINDKCVLCGICVPFCPVGALELEKNQKASEILKDATAMPELPDFEKINGVQIRRMFDGTIEVDEKKCPKECEECVAACPIGIIERNGKKVSIDKESCVYCGACMNACPEDAISIKRNRIYAKNGFSATFTKSIETFLGYEKNNLMLNHKSVIKLKNLVSDEELKEYVR